MAWLRPVASGQHVEVIGIERESRSAILQDEAHTFDGEVRAEECPIDDGKVRGVFAGALQHKAYWVS
jgi:hypothetical protein